MSGSDEMGRNRSTDIARRARAEDLHSGIPPSLPATNAKRLRKGATATKQSITPQVKTWIASLRSQ
jgi:hypothetical protein